MLHFPFRSVLLQVPEQNGEENGAQATEEQDGEEGSQEEAVVVDADSTDAVLINGNEADEEWGTNNEGTSSA